MIENGRLRSGLLVAGTVAVALGGGVASTHLERRWQALTRQHADPQQ